MTDKSRGINILRKLVIGFLILLLVYIFVYYIALSSGSITSELLIETGDSLYEWGYAINPVAVERALEITNDYSLAGHLFLISILLLFITSFIFASIFASILKHEGKHRTLIPSLYVLFILGNIYAITSPEFVNIVVAIALYSQIIPVVLAFIFAYLIYKLAPEIKIE